MSRSELQRFADEAEKAPVPLDRYGGMATVADLAARLRQDGYDVSDAEIEEARLGAAQSDGGVFVVAIGVGLRLALPRPSPLVGRAGLDAIFAHMRKQL